MTANEDAISLREAAKQLRDRADFLDGGGDTTLVPHYRALARLLDGDGGLLALHHEDHSSACSYCHCKTCPPCPTRLLVAAYVSTVLGATVEA